MFRVIAAALVGIALLCMEALIREHVVSPALVAAPSEIAARLVTLFVRESFWRDCLATIGRSAAGGILGFASGLGVGIVAYLLGKRGLRVDRAVDVARSIPVTALIPLFIAAFGLTTFTYIAIGSFAACVTSTVAVWLGCVDAARRWQNLLHLYRPSQGRELRQVIIPAAMPTLLVSLRLAISIALVLIVVAEMLIGTSAGVGKVINSKTYSDDRPGQYAAVLAAGLIGVGLNALFGGVAASVRAWLSTSER